MLRHAMLWLILVLALMSVRIVSAGAEETEIVVIGYGTAHMMPDCATIQISISTFSRTAQEAADSNSALHARVVEALRGLGIGENQMQTSYYSIDPVYPKDNHDRADRSKRPVGYTGDHAIKIWIDELDRLGAVIDAALAAGATSTHLSFTSSKLEEGNRLALEDAAKQAKADAEALAKAVGARLGPLILLTTHIPPQEPGVGVPVGAGEGWETSIMPRELRINAKVLGKWKLAK